MTPFFSVVVPVYNVQDYLQRCADSILKQSYQSFEIILVDDGSTDSSGRLCDELARQQKAISVVHKENGGLGSARNAGLDACRGEYVLFVDSDDWIEQNTLENIHSRLSAMTVDIVTYGYIKRENEEAVLKEVAAFPEGHYDRQQIQNRILPDSIAREPAFNQVKLPTQLSACMCAYRRGFLEKYHIRFESEREILSEDWLFNICCLTRAENMIVIHDCFYNYDTREGSLSQSYKADTYERKRKLYVRYQEELKATDNWNALCQRRMKNFWLEAIYCCVIIEFANPDWKQDGKKKIEVFTADPEFRQYISELKRSNSTKKGLLFVAVVKLKLFGFLRFVYLNVKK